MALEFTRVRDALRRLVVVAEWERIARELHDRAIQTLYGLGLDLQGLAGDGGAATVVGRLDAVLTSLLDPDGSAPACGRVARPEPATPPSTEAIS